MEHGQPWIFVCPQECARSVKLALEARGWLDDSRKMQSYGDPDAEATPSVAIPLTEEAVEELQAISEAEAEEVDVGRGGTTASDDLPPAPAEVAEALPEPDSRCGGRGVESCALYRALFSQERSNLLEARAWPPQPQSRQR